jgi:hypothetical protein
MYFHMAVFYIYEWFFTKYSLVKSFLVLTKVIVRSNLGSYIYTHTLWLATEDQTSLMTKLLLRGSKWVLLPLVLPCSLFCSHVIRSNLLDDKAAFTEKQMGAAAISAAVQLAVINRVPYCCRDHAVQY